MSENFELMRLNDIKNIQEIRHSTEVGMLDAKKAYLLADRNVDRAIDILRRQGSTVNYNQKGFDPIWINAVTLKFKVSRDEALDCLLKCGFNIRKIFDYFKEPFDI